jgi:hypothetical protein
VPPNKLVVVIKHKDANSKKHRPHIVRLFMLLTRQTIAVALTAPPIIDRLHKRPVSKYFQTKPSNPKCRQILTIVLLKLKPPGELLGQYVPNEKVSLPAKALHHLKAALLAKLASCQSTPASRSGPALFLYHEHLVFFFDCQDRQDHETHADTRDCVEITGCVQVKPSPEPLI